MAAEKRTVSPDSIRMIELGHPWIIADSFTAKWPAGAAGDLIELVDQQGRLLATALLDPGERIVARILARQKMQLDLDWLQKRLEQAIAAAEQSCRAGRYRCLPVGER